MVALTLLTRILNLALALIAVAILKISITVLGVLTLIVIILTLDIIFEVRPGGIIAFASWIETTISSSMFSVDRILLLKTRMFHLCFCGFGGCLLRFLVLLFGIRFLVLVLFEAVLLVPSAARAITCLRNCYLPCCCQMIRYRLSLNLILARDRNDLP